MISGQNMIEINEVQSKFKSLTCVEFLIRIWHDTSNHHWRKHNMRDQMGKQLMDNNRYTEVKGLYSAEDQLI